MRSGFRNRKKLFLLIPLFFGVFIVSFFATRIISTSSLFREPGILIYDESLTDAERELISSRLPEGLQLEYDISISASYVNEIFPSVGSHLIDILVPVTDYYEPQMSISSADLESFHAGLPSDRYRFLSISDLDHEQKLLRIDDDYYLDTLNKGAVYRYITILSREDCPEDLDQITSALSDLFITPPTTDDVLTFTQTGVTALGRRLNSKMSEVGDGTYFVDPTLADYFRGRDLLHTSSESSFYDYASGSVICSDPRFLSTLTTIGLDVVELTGNHNLDCGADAAISTISTYDDNHILTVGGGTDVDDASIPLEISQKSTDITMIAFNYSTGGYTTGAYPGAAPYDEARVAAQIADAKSRNRFVIIDIQFNECNAYANYIYDTTCDAADSSVPRDGYSQSAFFRHMVDLGADMVVGTSAHQAQTYELYEGHPIFYGLGNLFFDQTYWPDTARSLVLNHYFYQGKYIQTRLSGTIMHDDFVARTLDEAALIEWVTRLHASRP